MKNQKIINSNKNRQKIREMSDPFDTSLIPNNFYFWGFLWSDGYVSYGDKNRVSLEITTDDYDLIKNIVPKQFNTYTRQRKNRKHQTAAVSCRKDIARFFQKNGYIEKVSPSNWLLNHELSYYWYRGCIDGDGSWYFNNKNTRQFCISSKYTQNWVFFTHMLERLGCNFSIKLRNYSDSKYSIIRITKKESLKRLILFLYPSMVCDIGLQRKFYTAYKIYQSIT